MFPRPIHVEAHTFNVCVVRHGGFELLGLAVKDFGHLLVAKTNILLIQERPALGSIFVGEALDESMVGDKMRGNASISANHTALENVPARRTVFEVRRPFQFLIDNPSRSDHESTATEGLRGADVIIAQRAKST